MKNADYWRGRFSILEESAHNQSYEYLQSLEEMFTDAQRKVQADIERWYGRFATNNGISLTEARKLLTTGQLEEFRWTVDQYIKIGQQNNLSAEWLKKLENASAKFHVSRLEAIQTQIQQQIEFLYGNQLDGLDSLLKQIAGNGYTQTAFSIQKGIGLGWDITALNQKKLETLLSKPWTTDGRTFSDRIWIKKAELIGNVQKELTQGLLRGDSPQKITGAIQKRFNVSRYQAGRLVHTETSYFNAISAKQAYQDLGVEKVEILETLDSHTCEICQPLDGVVIPLAQFEPGVTVPPFHPNCVLPETVIASPDGEAIMQSDYSGEIVEFTTANGRRLGITPNHIMLTSRGWVRAKNLIQGDQVIYYCGWDKLIVEPNPAHDNRVPAVEQLFASFLESCAVPPISVPTTAKDLKGDAVENGKVDIIFIDSLLRSKLDSSAGKFFGDLPLIGTGKTGEVLLYGNCSLAQFLMGAGFASDGIMGGLDIAGILLTGSITHHQLVRLRGGAHYNTRLRKTALNNGFSDRELSGNFVNATARIIQGDDFIQREFFSGVGLPDGDSNFIQNTNNGLSRTSKDIGDFCNAFPGVVEFDNIISIDRRFFTGHVYDISSQSTLYLCNGFLSSNCRGTTCPYFDDMDGERAARNADGEVYYVPANMTYTQWKKAFVDGVKDALPVATAGEVLKRIRDYESEFGKKFGKEHYDEIRDRVDACENPNLQKVWNAYEGKIKVADPHCNGRAYCSGNNIYVGISKDAKARKYFSPYSTTFHESGHAIDGLAAQLGSPNGQWHFSSTYKNGLFPKTIKEEVDDWVKSILSDMKTHKSDFQYWVDKGWITQGWADYYASQANFKPLKSMAFQAVKQEIQELEPLQTCDISDILEGATRGKIQCGVGHGGGSYWTKRTWNGVDWGLGTEAFAEMTSATMTCPESLETIKKYLPKSYALYEEMIEAIAGQI
ncbi:putative uncharacterized protein [Firmicutes bacterium CAG:137]|nr:putative uncharacterized protein [Firmicutes bacterium CAG:137]